MSAIAGLVHQPTLAPPGQAAAALPLLMRRVDGPQWDLVVAGFDAVCQEQLYAFAARRWPGTAPEPILFEHLGRLVGGVLILIQPLPLGLGKIAVAKWAPMLADTRVPNAAAIHAGMIEALIAEYGDRRGMMLSILPRASTAPINDEYVALRKRGFHRGATLLFPNRYLVSLRQSDDDQRKSLLQAWRRQLNKADKSGLSFEHAQPQAIEDFKHLYAAMTERKQFPDHSAYETLDGLMALEEPLRPELFFVRHAGKLVAGALVFKAGDRAVYLYGATTDDALPLRAGYFLHWHIIRWLRDNTRADWYDLGGTDGFQGLHQFKKGMVGTAGVIRPVPPVANYASRPLPYLLGAAAFAARDFVHHLRRRLDAFNPNKARPDQPPHVTEDYLK